MAPVQMKLRKALGVVKDQTSIQIAKVAGSPELDVTIVKATSHDEFPTEERHIQELIRHVSFSRGYTNACIAGLSKRLSKTANWIVALKSLMVIHRLLRDADPVFEHEVKQAGRYGVRLLNMASFRDDSESSAWDYSAFVRTYSLYLDERLDYFASATASASPPSGQRSFHQNEEWRSHFERRSSYDERRSPYHERRSSYDERQNSFREDRRPGGFGHSDDQDQDARGTREAVPMKEMKAEALLEELPKLQRVLDRALGCRPTGAAKINRLIQVALYAIVVESFQLHGDFVEGIGRLREVFPEMEYAVAARAFDIYERGAKQLAELHSFYMLCMDIGVGRSSEYPSVKKVSVDELDELHGRLRDGRSSVVVRRPDSPEPRPRRRSPSPPREQSYEDTLEMKALPAPPVAEPEPVVPPPEPERTDADLVNLREGELTAEQEEDKLALALFSENGTKDRPGMPRNGFEGTAGWELALVESASNLAGAKGETLAGGFDHLLLDSMYEQAGANRRSAAVPSGSESSVASTGIVRKPSDVLALPAPPSGPMPGEDPFAASAVVPPPPYVQMADVVKKQQLLVQEQQMWHQYQYEGMRGTQSMMNVRNQTPYGMPQPHFAIPYYGHGMPRQ